MAHAADPATAFTVRTGVVDRFDGPRGEGEIVDDDAVHRWPFHCTRIADGTRSIEIGAQVEFHARPGPTGLEAVAVAHRPHPG